MSETFILAQAGALRSFRPQFVALQRSDHSLAVPSNALFLTAKRSTFSRARKAAYDVSGFAPAFHRKIRDAKPALVHAHFATDGASALAFVDILKVPLIVTLHGHDVATSDEFWQRSLVGRLYLARRSRLWKRASLFVCVSRFIRDTAINAGFPENRLRVHYIGIDRSKCSVVRRDRERVVLFVGRLVPMKGCEFLLRAMHVVQRTEPDVKLVVIGDGTLRFGLEELSRDLRIRCEFLGRQPSTVVRDWMSRVRMLCVPSVTAHNGEREGLGIVILEAQAVGTPIVGFRTGGIPEAIHEGCTGLLVGSEDVIGLSNLIMRYLADDGLWQTSSVHAVEWVASRFDLLKQTPLLETFYQEVVDGARS